MDLLGIHRTYLTGYLSSHVFRILTVAGEPSEEKNHIFGNTDWRTWPPTAWKKRPLRKSAYISASKKKNSAESSSDWHFKPTSHFRKSIGKCPSCIRHFPNFAQFFFIQKKSTDSKQADLESSMLLCPMKIFGSPFKEWKKNSAEEKTCVNLNCLH